MSLSEDGRRLVYSRTDDATNLWVSHPVNPGAEGTLDTRQLTFGIRETMDPRISPDGKRVVFDDSGAIGGLHVAKLPDGEASQLVFEHASHPVWSLSGDSIAYGASRAEVHGFWARSSDDSQPGERLLVTMEELTAQVGDSEFKTGGGALLEAWLPGERLVFSRSFRTRYYYLFDYSKGEGRLLAHGGDARPEVRDAQVRAFGPPILQRDYRVVGSLSFSPDGKRVAYWADGDLKVAPIDGGPEVSLGTDLHPMRWTSGGDSLYARNGSFEEMTKIWIVPLAGGEPEIFVNVPDGFSSTRVWGTDIAPDGSSIVRGVKTMRGDLWMVEFLDPGGL
jgi:Tol biopolymer transport system component